MTKDSGSESKRKGVKPSPGSTKGSILRAKITPAPPEMLERLKHWHIYSINRSRRPTTNTPPSSDSAQKPSPAEPKS